VSNVDNSLETVDLLAKTVDKSLKDIIDEFLLMDA
jgi:hypothetical protein